MADCLPDRTLARRKRAAEKIASRVAAQPAMLSYRSRQDETTRRDMVDGDLLLFRGKGLLSELIRHSTHSPYTHAGLLYRRRDRVFCLEAVGHGVRLVPVSWLLGEYAGGVDYFRVTGVKPRKKEAALDWAFSRLGAPYDLFGLARFALAMARHSVIPEDGNDSWFCSELVARAYVNVDEPLVDQVATFTSPAELGASSKVEFVGSLKLES